MPLKRKLTRALELPGEAVLGLPLLTMTGKEELYIENYKGLVEYTEENLRIHTGAGLVHIRGKELNLSTVSAEGVLIRGRIKSIEFL